MRAASVVDQDVDVPATVGAPDRPLVDKSGRAPLLEQLARALEHREPPCCPVVGRAGTYVEQLGPYGTAAKQLKVWDLKR